MTDHPAAPPTDWPLEQTLRDRFGLAQFRLGQEDVIRTVLRGQDCLCVMPTGGGKSLCFQLPALLQDGVALVVSPLIALMKDQVDALVQRGISATLINSSVDVATQNQRLVGLQAGDYDLVYVAPERFRSVRFRNALAHTNVSLLAIDEAHCISEWGHDFRPDYCRLGMARESLNNPPTIALTATATDRVREDICSQLELHDPALFVSGFDRPNLHYEVWDSPGDTSKLESLQQIFAGDSGSAIIYCSSRKKCEEVVDFVRRKLRRQAVLYHAGLNNEDRKSAQDEFMSKTDCIVVATNAFGMGVDKPDIRTVVHYNLPGTVEAYYQEAGRAGRDGLDSSCILLFARGDRFIQEFFIDSQYPDADVIFTIYKYLARQRSNPIELTQAEIKERLDLPVSEMAVGASLKLLERADVLERLRPRENLALVRIESDVSLVSLLHPSARTQRKVLGTLESMLSSFGDEVYFSPHWLAKRLELEVSQLTRALGELTQKLPMIYVPPFRGNAIRMIDRQRELDQLDIDFDALQQRKKYEYGKLDQVIRYASIRKCRRFQILRYFGDKSEVECGKCDVCGSGTAIARSDPDRPEEASPEYTVIVRKMLSGIARCKGRFGKTVIAAMLAGSQSQAVKKSGLHKLSTYGLLDQFTQSEIVELIEASLLRGWTKQVEKNRFRPLVEITESGREVMKGHDQAAGWEDLGTALQKKIAVTPGRTTAPPPESNTPSVATTRGLPDHAIELPQQPAPEDGQDHLWTWRLLQREFSLDECCAIRRLSRARILEHVLKILRENRFVELELVLTDEKIGQLQARTLAGSPDSPTDAAPVQNQLEAIELEIYSLASTMPRQLALEQEPEEAKTTQ